MEGRAPLNSTVPNLDTDVDADAGRLLRRPASALVATTANRQKWVYDQPTSFTIDGNVRVDLFVTNVDFGMTGGIRVAVMRCNDAGDICVPWLSSSLWLPSGSLGFTQVSFVTNTPVVKTFASTERLELWVTTDWLSTTDLVLAYDAEAAPAAFAFDLAP